MAIPTWPNSLPQAPLLTEYNEQYTTLAQSVTTGNKSILIRRNSTRAQDKLSVSFALTKTQVQDFETFFYDTLFGGTSRFSFTHPRKKTTIEVSFDPTSEQSFSIAPMETMAMFKLQFTLIVWV